MGPVSTEVSIAREILVDWGLDEAGQERRLAMLATIRAFFRNLAELLPWREHSGVAARNMLRKVVRLSSCCGNHGQPGC